MDANTLVQDALDAQTGAGQGPEVRRPCGHRPAELLGVRGPPVVDPGGVDDEPADLEAQRCSCDIAGGVRDRDTEVGLGVQLAVLAGALLLALLLSMNAAAVWLRDHYQKKLT